MKPSAPPGSVIFLLVLCLTSIDQMQSRISDYDYEFECPQCKGKQKRSIGWIRGSRWLPYTCGSIIDAARIAVEMEAILARAQSSAARPERVQKRKATTNLATVKPCNVTSL